MANQSSKKRRTRSDSTPATGGASANYLAEFAQGRAQVSKRWNSWSAQSTYGIPLGSKTAREAARPFWNSDMLQQRMENILEYASQEASSVTVDDHCDTKELEDLDDDSEFSGTDEQTTIVHVTSGDDECASTTDDDEALNSIFFATALIPRLGSETTAEVCIEDQSALQSMNSDSGETDRDKPLNYAVRSAPILDERHIKHREMFPITVMLSQSAHAICCN